MGLVCAAQVLLQKKAPCQLAGSDSEAENDDDDEDHDEVPAARSSQLCCETNRVQAPAVARSPLRSQFVGSCAWVRGCEMKNRRIRLRC